MISLDHPRRFASRVCSLAVLLAACASLVLHAQETTSRTRRDTYDLSAARTIGQVIRMTADLQVGGDLHYKGKGRQEKLPISVVAKLVYEEKLLLPGGQGDVPLRSIRHYETAEAAIKFASSAAKPTLADTHRLIVVQIEKGTATLFSPQGAMTREELDLITVVGNSLVIDSLLPGARVKVAEAWKHPDDVIAALLGLDAVAQCEVESVLTDVEDGVAHISMAGTVSGAAEGVSTDIDVKAKYHFDLGRHRITRLNMAIKEKRSIGHVAPGLDVVAKLSLKLDAIDQSEYLTEEVISDLPTDPEAELTQLANRSSEGGFQFSSDRRWYVTLSNPGVTVMRMVDRGDLVAQCNISPVVSRSAKKYTSIEQYQNDVRHSLGKTFGRLIKASQWTDSHGQLVYSLVIHGQVEKLPIEWRYYLIAHPGGRRVAVAFTVEGDFIRRLGEADRELVGTIQLSELSETTPETATADTATKPGKAKVK